MDSLPGALKGSDMMLFEVANSLGLIVDICPQLNYLAYHEELNSNYCNTHWIGKSLSDPVLTDKGDTGQHDMNEILADFPTELGRIKWSYNQLHQGIHEEM